MADPYGPIRQGARSMLRDSDEYREAVRLGIGRRWLAREGDALTERLLDEAWKWAPRDPATFPRNSDRTENQ